MAPLPGRRVSSGQPTLVAAPPALAVVVVLGALAVLAVCLGAGRREVLACPRVYGGQFCQMA
ncbi:hypothetical protein EII12_10910 [Buchananella hordeovulneris]|uniref:hypothetical protein n=1 Tax=Buchananella hordeovulneris TaxID=52770 RepID=UPI000F5FF0BE|nr:hypothetical protein [Buchananella hordeovulneris]RRD48874.1 hypothetical protein EII12_10910 [Buchananella hordeovulneris]